MRMMLALALAVPVIAAAQPALAQGQPSAAATAAAATLVDTLTPPASSKAALDQQLAGVRQGNLIRAQLGNNPRFKEKADRNEPAFTAALARMGVLQANALGPIYTEMQGSVRTASIEAYATNFTIPEMTAATTFYRTPVGTKLLRTQPQLAAQVNQRVQQQFAPRLQAAQQALAPKIDAELKTLFPPLPAAK
ncbi:DUF2059 domain-containing protein [Polymorphobacter sp.]|uniref:DUF2059 domain-containing protein n=1 Tax=Polymorphobacter sp. TaxID=1909290 RepID=UPI003F6FC110